MRLLRIDPFTRKVTREYYDMATGIVNFYTQTSELRMIGLGQEHELYIDDNWALREKQAFWTLAANPEGCLGGYAVITGSNMSNCSLPADAVQNMMTWIEPEMASLHPVVQGLRAEMKGFLPREVVLQGRTGPESVH